MAEKGKKKGSWVSKMAIGLALGLLTFLALGLWADIDKLAEAFQSFDHRLLVSIFLLSLANYGIRALRWHYYLKVAGHQVPIGISVGIFASGLAMSVTWQAWRSDKGRSSWTQSSWSSCVFHCGYGKTG